MKFFYKRKDKQNPCAASTVQTGECRHHPFCELDRYTPLCTREDALYTALREAVPVIDAAIYKLVRLTGGFTVQCSGKQAQAELDSFLM